MSVSKGSVSYGSVLLGSVKPGSVIKDGSKITNQFIAEWDTTLISTGSSASNQVSLPLLSGGTYNFTVKDWGDGGTDVITAWDQAETTHTYTVPGVYTITIEGEIAGFNFNNSRDKLKIGDVLECGPLRLLGGAKHFQGCSNINFALSVDTLNLEGMTSLLLTWDQCTNLTDGLGNMDTSAITVFDSALRGSGYVGDLYWDMGECLNARRMLNQNNDFNGDISTLSAPKCKDFSQMFSNTKIDQNLGGLMPFSATNMGSLLTNTMATINWSNSLIEYALPTQTPASGSILSFSDNGAGGTRVTTSAPLPTQIIDGRRIVQTGTSQFDGIFFNIFNVNNATGEYDINQAFVVGGTPGNWDFDGVILQPNVPLGGGSSKYNLAGQVARDYLINSWSWVIADGGLEV